MPKGVNNKTGRGVRFNNLAGKNFDRLKVLDNFKIIKRTTFWDCICKCGKITSVSSSHLVTGHTTSCGCKKFENLGDGISAFNRLIDSYKQHAKKKKIKFLLTKEEFKYLTQQNCHYCNNKPAQIAKSLSNSGNYIYNGIDRLDSNLDYYIKNCVSCCSTCNIMKGILKEEEFLNHINKIYNFKKGITNG